MAREAGAATAHGQRPAHKHTRYVANTYIKRPSLERKQETWDKFHQVC